eukprot:30109-Pelagococcus_subviridis.AAC.4
MPSDARQNAPRGRRARTETHRVISSRGARERGRTTAARRGGVTASWRTPRPRRAIPESTLRSRRSSLQLKLSNENPSRARDSDGP